jgi:hypothetical protein
VAVADFVTLSPQTIYIRRCDANTDAHIFSFPQILPSRNTPAIEARLVELKQEHRDLDLAIEALLGTPCHDELRLKRMKKRKLLLKDQIAFLEAQLHPDISA